MTKKLFILILTLCLAVVGMTVVAMADAPETIYLGSSQGMNWSISDNGYILSYDGQLDGTFEENQRMGFTVTKKDMPIIQMASYICIILRLIHKAELVYLQVVT